MDYDGTALAAPAGLQWATLQPPELQWATLKPERHASHLSRMPGKRDAGGTATPHGRQPWQRRRGAAQQMAVWGVPQ